MHPISLIWEVKELRPELQSRPIHRIKPLHKGGFSRRRDNPIIIDEIRTMMKLEKSEAWPVTTCRADVILCCCTSYCCCRFCFFGVLLTILRVRGDEKKQESNPTYPLRISPSISHLAFGEHQFGNINLGTCITFILLLFYYRNFKITIHSLLILCLFLLYAIRRRYWKIDHKSWGEGEPGCKNYLLRR